MKISSEATGVSPPDKDTKGKKNFYNVFKSWYESHICFGRDIFLEGLMDKFRKHC